MIENTELIANPKQRCATRNTRSYRTEEREGASHRGVRRHLGGTVEWSERRNRGIRFEHLQRSSRSATSCRNMMAVINEWRRYWRTQARQERKMERKWRGSRRGRQRGKLLCAPDLELAGHIHKQTSRLTSWPTKLSTVNSLINIVQHESKGRTPQKWPKTGRASTHYRRNSKVLTLAEARKRKLQGARWVRQVVLQSKKLRLSEKQVSRKQTVKIYYLGRQLELTNGQNAMHEHKCTKSAESSASIVRRITHLKCAKKIQNYSRLQDPTQ